MNWLTSAKKRTSIKKKKDESFRRNVSLKLHSPTLPKSEIIVNPKPNVRLQNQLGPRESLDVKYLKRHVSLSKSNAIESDIIEQLNFSPLRDDSTSWESTDIERPNDSNNSNDILYFNNGFQCNTDGKPISQHSSNCRYKSPINNNISMSDESSTMESLHHLKRKVQEFLNQPLPHPCALSNTQHALRDRLTQVMSWRHVTSEALQSTLELLYCNLNDIRMPAPLKSNTLQLIRVMEQERHKLVIMGLEDDLVSIDNHTLAQKTKLDIKAFQPVSERMSPGSSTARTSGRTDSDRFFDFKGSSPFLLPSSTKPSATLLEDKSVSMSSPCVKGSFRQQRQHVGGDNVLNDQIFSNQAYKDIDINESKRSITIKDWDLFQRL